MITSRRLATLSSSLPCSSPGAPPRRIPLLGTPHRTLTARLGLWHGLIRPVT